MNGIAGLIGHWRPSRSRQSKALLLVLSTLSLAFGLQALVQRGIPTASAQSMGYGTMGLRSDSAAEGNPLTMIRREMVPMVRAAEKFLKEKKYQEALDKLREADAVATGRPTDKVPPPPKTKYETLALERMRGVAALGAGDLPLAAQSFEVVIDSGSLSATEQHSLLEHLVIVYYNAKDYGRAQAWARRYIKSGGTSKSVSDLSIRSQYLSGDFVGAAAALRAAVTADEQAGRVPSLENLSMLGSSYVNLNDQAGYVQTLEWLVVHYPKREYWADLIARYQVRPGVAPRLLLDFDRLRFATGNIIEARAYLAMAQLAMQAGYPAEARKIIEAGYQNNALGTGDNAEQHHRLRDTVARQLAEDQKVLAKESGSRDADGQASTGYAYATLGQTDKGIALLEQAIASGALKYAQDAKLHLGMVHLQAGDKARALSILQSVTDSDGTADLAHLWLLYSKGGGSARQSD